MNHYATTPEKDNSEGRHLALGRHMIKLGWSTTLLFASTSHPDGKQRLHSRNIRHLSQVDGVDCVWVRTNAYHRSRLRRILGIFMFTFNVLLPSTTRGLERPSAIIGSTVHPLAAWAGKRLADRYKVPFIFEIRDVWPETLVDLKAIRPESLVALSLKSISNYLISAAQLVISPLPGVSKLIAEGGFVNKGFLWISNGIETSGAGWVPNVRNHSAFTFMYLGSHGVANALDIVLDAFQLAVSRSARPLRLRFVGDGPEKLRLLKRAEQLGIGEFVSFERSIARSRVVSTLQEADCLVISSLGLDVYRYGISANKLFDYLISGRPVIAAVAGVYNNPVADAGAGLTVEGGNPDKLCDAMLEVSQSDLETLNLMGQQGFTHALNVYSYEALAAKLAKGLDELVETDR